LENKNMRKNDTRNSLFTLLLLGLCLAFPALSNALPPDPVIFKHQEQWYTLSQTYVYGIATGDLDNDGTPEIVTAGRYHTGETSYAGEQVRYGQIKIWNWNGTAYALRHTLNWTLAGDGSPWWRGIQALTIDDVDNDGTKEIITAGYVWEHISVPPWMGTYESEIGIWNWNGTTLQLEHQAKWWNLTGVTNIKDMMLNDVWTSDVDGDGVKEIATCGTYSNMTTFLTHAQLNVWNWNGTIFTGEHNQTWQAPERVEPNSIFAKDVDNDGQVEILTGGYRRDGSIYTSQLRIWNWNGTAMSLKHNEEWDTNSTRGVITVFADNVDQEGLPDILTGGFGNATSFDMTKVWNWNGTHLSLIHNEEDPFSQGEYVYAFNHADADTDGKPELVSFGHIYNGTTWLTVLKMLEWTGTGMTLDHYVTWGNNSRGLDMCIGDMDDDYHNEILTASWEHDGTRWNSQLTIGYYADANPPWIETPIQNPPDNVTIEQEVKISANITDLETGIKNATLYYSTNNGTSWTPIEMQYNATTKLYETIYPIPAQPLDTCILYKITAYDNAENQYTEDNAGSYYVYSVIPEYTMLLPLLFMTATLIAFALTRTRKKP
jgi:hypothetical protein